AGRDVSRSSRVMHDVDASRWAHAVTSMFEDRGGKIWAGVDRGVGLIENDRFAAVSGLPGGLTRSIAEDKTYVWIANDAAGLFRVSSSRHLVEHVDLGQSRVHMVAADPGKSGVWLGFAAGGVAHYVDGRIREAYSPADGLGQGVVRWLSLDADGTLWIA